MQTPWGRLAGLDLASLDLCSEILSRDKHQLAEGLVVESLVDQIYARIPAHRPSAILLDVDTAIVRHDGAWLAFVLVHRRQPGLGRYLNALERGFGVHVVERDKAGDLVMRRFHQGAWCGEAVPLETAMAALSGRARPEAIRVADDVRDIRRHKASFWGYLCNRYGEALGERVVLPRLFLNCGVQPWFRAVWNLDRVLVDGDQVWFLEIKHKFPMDRGSLAFGLNLGETNVIEALAGAGIRCLHTILVKPRWDKTEGAAYLIGGLDQRERAVFIATEVDADCIAAMRAGGQQQSGANTTLVGSGTQTYLSLPASGFVRLGVFSAPSTVAESIANFLGGGALQPVTDALLRAARVSTR